MIFEDIFKEIGDFGRGQIIQYFLLCWPFLMAGFLSVDVVFLMAVPDFVCLPNEINMTDLQNILNISLSDIVNNLVSIQKSINIYENGRCKSWNNSINFIELLTSASSYYLNNTFTKRNLLTDGKCTSGFIYSQKEFGNTISSEYHLVCDLEYVRTNLKTVFFSGRIFGALIFGQLSDIIGRLYTFLIVAVFNLICGIGLYFSASQLMIGVFLLFQGFTQVGYTLTTFVLGNEMVGMSKRVWSGIVFQFFYSAAFILIPLCYLGIKNWRYLALLSGLPGIVFLMYFFCVHESPRWLLTRGRNQEALVIIEKVARINRVTLSSNLKSDIGNYSEIRKDSQDLPKKYSVIDLIKTKSMCFLTLNICFNWIANALIYYGIIYNVENLAGSLYLNFVFLGLVEIPANVFSLLLLDRIGRQKLLIITLWITGASCLLAGCISKNYRMIKSVIAIFGKMTVTMSYCVIYFYTTELFHTSVRNVGMGVSSMSARIGGTLAVPILYLEKYFNPLPMIIFSVMSFIAGGLTFIIPETKGKPLDQHFNHNYVKDEKMLSGNEEEKL